jgi:REP element-mobilizing transposase RayT
MRKDFTKIYLHCVWNTWDRLPLLTPDLEPPILAAIATKCKELQVTVIALNAAVDHVHLLVQIPPTLSVSELMQQVKGASSHLANRLLQRASAFRWSGFYAVFSVSESDVDRVAEYIRHQKERHAEKLLILEWELLEKEKAAPTPVSSE